MTDINHTPTPWLVFYTQIRSADGDILIVRPNHPENGKNWDADAAFVVNAVNNHEALMKCRAEIIEECARISEFFNDGAHIAHDMQTGIFPKRSATRDAIADKIRALALPPSKESV